MKEPNKISSREVTAPAVYFNRRKFIQAGVLAASAVASGVVYRHLNPIGTLDKHKVNTAAIEGVTKAPSTTKRTLLVFG